MVLPSPPKYQGMCSYKGQGGKVWRDRQVGISDKEEKEEKGVGICLATCQARHIKYLN